MQKTKHAELIILGSGPAGCTAAVYAARANLQPILITGAEPGGQLTTSYEVDNWPGDVNGVDGTALMDRMLAHAKRFNTEIISDVIESVDLKVKPFRLTGQTNSYTCDALIIATGASAKYLGIASEKKYAGKGVSACATCDGFFYKGMPVAIIGGGNTAVEEALYLSNIASEVYVVHWRNQFKAEKIMTDKLTEKSVSGNVKIKWNSELIEILGDEQSVNAIKIKNTQTNQIEDIKVAGVFIAIGHAPNSRLFNGQIDMENERIKIKSGLAGNATATNIPGVFAAGDVCDNIYRQAITSAGTGCQAALDVKNYLLTSRN